MTSSLYIRYRRAEVGALWIVVVTIVCVGAGLLAFAVGASFWWAYGLGAGILPVVPRAFRRDWFEAGVGRWNKAVGMLTRLLSAITMRICFYLLIFVEGRTGSALRLKTPEAGGSMWTDCETHASPLVIMDCGEAGRGRWLLDLVSFARRPGNGWMVLLVPFLFTLMLLGDEEEDTTPPTSTYTLY